MEFHGDLAMSTVNFEDDKWSDIGFCLRPVDLVSVTEYDCLLIRFYYSSADIANVESPAYTETFVGYDLHAPRLDMSYMLPADLRTDHLDSNIDAADADKSGSWTINVTKSSKECPSIGNCVFNAHFFRNFVTGEAGDDIQVNKGAHEKFEAYAFATQYTDLGAESRETTFYEVGQDQNIYLENLTGVPASTKQRKS